MTPVWRALASKHSFLERALGSRARRKTDSKLVVVAGGYRSGSTLQYNLLGEFLERTRQGHRIGFMTPPDAEPLDRLWAIVDAAGIAVVKQHHYVAGYLDWEGQDEAWLELAGRRPVHFVATVRDWKDVAASMSRFLRIPPSDLFESREWRENVANVERVIAAGALVQRYEDLRASPIGSLRTLVAAVGAQWSLPAGFLAASATRSGVARRRQADVSKGTWHGRTLLHPAHIETPEGGAWLSWSTGDRELLERACARLQRRYGYAT